MSCRRITTMLITALVMTLFASVMLAAKDSSMGIADKQTLTFYVPTVVGGILLPAGNYTITHEMQGQTHIMIFKQVGGKAEVKATCTLVPLTVKATRSEQLYVQNAKDQKVLVEMTFRGDTAKHVLAQ